MSEVAFTVYGTPYSKGSGSKTKHGVYIEDGTNDKKLADGTKRLGTRSAKRLWANTVESACKGLVISPMDGAIYCGVRFYFAAPRAGKTAKRWYHNVVPDLDKLIRAIWDPMTAAGLIHDDSRIVKILYAEKLTIHDGSLPRVEVLIGTLWDQP